MKKIILVVLFIMIGGAVVLNMALASAEPIDIYFFRTETCPYCKMMGEFIAEKMAQVPQMVVHEFDVIKDKQAPDLLASLAEVYGVTANGVPVVFLDEVVVNGYDPSKFEAALLDCQKNGCASPLEKIGQSLDNNNPAHGGRYAWVGWLIVVAAVIVVVLFIALKFYKKKKIVNTGQ